VLLKWQLGNRRRLRRLRRGLGLPALSGRTWLLTMLAFVGLAYLGVTVVADFVMKIRQYAPQWYEPRDFQREEFEEKKP
jgi:hypothetical protein